MRAALALVVSVMLVACGSRDGGDAKPTPSATASTGPGVTDPRLDTMARAAAACSAYAGVIDPACPAMKAWSEPREPSRAGGRADASLVAMLSDTDEKIRYLAAFKLNQHGRAFKTDKALASSVLDAADKETSKFAAFELGASVGRIAIKDTGAFDRVKAILERHALRELRRGVLSTLLYDNADDPRVFDLVRDAVKDDDKVVALAALRAFWTGGTTRPDATCQIYLDHADDPNEEIAAEASNALSWYGKCGADYDRLLDSLERRIKTGPPALPSASYVTAARHVCEDATATDKQKKRASEVGRAAASNTLVKVWVRIAALDTVAGCDPGAAAKLFLAKFAGDTDRSLADKAKELLTKLLTKLPTKNDKK